MKLGLFALSSAIAKPDTLKQWLTTVYPVPTSNPDAISVEDVWRLVVRRQNGTAARILTETKGWTIPTIILDELIVAEDAKSVKFILSYCPDAVDYLERELFDRVYSSHPEQAKFLMGRLQTLDREDTLLQIMQRRIGQVKK